MREFMKLLEGQGDVLLHKQITLKDGTPATLTAKEIGYGISVNVETADDFCGGTTFGENDWAGMPGTWSAMTSHVNPEWRRKGVATAVYDAMEEMGHTVVPEPRDHKRTADADAFWKNRKLKESVAPQSLIDVANFFLDTRDDLLDHDEDVDRLVPGDEAFAEEIIRREYVSGTCGAYAIALHDKTSYPIIGFNGGTHIAVRSPDGDIIDYLGKNPVANVLKRYGMGKNTPVQEWTREEAVEHILMGAEEGDPWDEISIAKWVLAHRSQLRETDYRGEHQAPGKEGGAPLYDLTAEGMYPEDVYGPNGMRYYAPEEPEAFSRCMAYKGRPNKVLTVYRAVPADLVRPKITPGDWVAITPAYAREHGRSHLQGAFKVITKTVYARDVYTEGNSLDEWGYDPQPFVSTAQEAEIRARLGMKTVSEIRAIQRAKAAEKQGVSESYEWKKTMRGDVEVMIDVDKVNTSAAKDRNFYVGPQGSGGVKGRYERFDNWMKGGAPVEMPEVCLTDAGEISFINGRHRFAWMRDHGVKTMPVAVPADYADAVREKFGA